MGFVYIHFSRHWETAFQGGSPSAPYGSSTFLAALDIACYWTVAVLVGGRGLPLWLRLAFPYRLRQLRALCLLAILISLFGAMKMWWWEVVVRDVFWEQGWWDMLMAWTCRGKRGARNGIRVFCFFFQFFNFLPEPLEGGELGYWR